MINLKINSASILLSLIFIFGFIIQIGAQNTSRTTLEREIKTNSNYIYIQSLQKDTLAGKNNAAEALWSAKNLENELLTNNSLKKTNVEYLIKPRGPKYMIIAYINKTLNNYVDVEEKGSQKGKKWELVIPIEIDEENKPNTEPKKNEVVIQNKKTEPVIKTTKKEHVEIRKSENNERKEVSEKKNIEPKQNVTAAKSSGKKFISSSTILNYLSNLSAFSDIVTYLNKQKMNGKLVYSYRYDAFKDNISDCYIIVFNSNTDELTMILNKGTETRMNVLNSQVVNENNLKNNTKKIYIYEF